MSRGYASLLLGASVMTYLLIVMGAVVCVTGAGQGCPDWPTCYGQIVPPPDPPAIIEVTHRVLAALASPLIIAAAVIGWRRHRAVRWLSRPPVIAVALVLSVVVFGAFAVLTGLPPAIAAIDVGSALMVLALMVAAATVAQGRRDNASLPDRLPLHTPLARLALWTVVAVFLVLVSGVLVAGTGSVVRCLGWPLYGTGGPAEVAGALPAARRVLGILAAALIVAVVAQAWRRHRGEPAILRAATALGILFAAELAVGLLIGVRGYGIALGVLYVAAAAGVWALSVAVVVRAGLAAASVKR